MQREHPLDTLAKGNLAHRERSGDALAVLAGNAHAFVVLHAGPGAFGDFIANAQGVARLEIGDFLPEGGDLLRLDLCDQVHLIFSYQRTVCPRR